MKKQEDLISVKSFLGEEDFKLKSKKKKYCISFLNQIQSTIQQVMLTSSD